MAETANASSVLEGSSSESSLLLPFNSSNDDRDVPAWMFVLIPVISAIVGFITNVLALRMSFFPVEFMGIKIWQPKGQPFGFFGWQGIVPAKAAVMATRLTDLFLTKLFDIREIFSRIDPVMVQKHCQPGTDLLTDKIIQKTMDLFAPNVYFSLSSSTKGEIRRAVSDQSSLMVSELMTRVQDNILDLLDLSALMGRLAEESKEKVVDMFLEVGQKEYRFVELSGLWFGLLFGCIQALIYYFYDAWWLLPAAGLLVGWCTNFLALKLIFEPAEPVYFLGLRIQGVFLKRQQEAAVSIADLSQNKFLTVEHIMEEISYGNGKDRFHELIHDLTSIHVRRMLSELGGILTPLLISSEFPNNVEAIIVSVIQDELGHVWPLAYKHIDEAMDLRETLRVKLQQLPPREFVGTLRPVFQEDEIKLIIVGAILGMIVGFLQQFLLIRWIT